MGTCIEYVYPGAPKQAIPHPLDLTAHASYEYYEPRPGFSPFSMLKNPMVMMMLSGGGMLLVPRMMESMDPEEREQMQRTMANQGNRSKMLSGMLKGMTGAEESQAVPQIERKQSAKSGGKTARRSKRD